jgi:hypothetical protein
LLKPSARSREAPVVVLPNDYGPGQCSARLREAPKEARLEMKQEQTELTYPKAGSQLAFARVATALAAVSVGALSIGALAIGALAIGRLVVKRFAAKNGTIDRLVIQELEVGRLRVRELITEPPPLQG